MKEGENMSMISGHWGGEFGFGMFLNEEEAASFEHVFAEKEGLYEDAVFDYIGENSVLSDAEYDMRHVWHLNGEMEDNDNFVYGVFLYSKRQGGITSTAKIYTDLDEMADEFRQRYGMYLPDNFDYVGHLCFLLGAKIS